MHGDGGAYRGSRQTSHEDIETGFAPAQKGRGNSSCFPRLLQAEIDDL